MAKRGRKLALTWEELTPKQQRFPDEYLLDLNATQAAIRSGYSERSARTAGYELLQHPLIEAKVAELAKARAERTGLTADRVLLEIQRMAWVDPLELYDEWQCLRRLKDIPEDTRRAIASIEVEERFEGEGKNRKLVGYLRKVKLWNKPQSNELLGRNLELFTDKKEIEIGETLAELLTKSHTPSAT